MLQGMTSGASSKTRDASEDSKSQNPLEIFRDQRVESTATADIENRGRASLAAGYNYQLEHMDHQDSLGPNLPNHTVTVTAAPTVENTSRSDIRQGHIGYLSSKINSLFTGCFNTNNKYVLNATKSQFHSPKDLQQGNNTLNHIDEHSPKTTAYCSGEGNNNYSMFAVNDFQTYSDKIHGGNNDCSFVSAGSDMFTKDLNTNWTPTSENAQSHHIYHMKNFNAYHTEPTQLPFNFEDIGSCIDGNRCRDKDCNFKHDQWSPFLSPVSPRSKHQKDPFQESLFDNYGYRRFAESGRYRSPCSTVSDLRSDDFEILQWDSNEEIGYQEGLSYTYKIENHIPNNKDSFNTAPNTPELNLSHLDGWHTAPNTPIDDDGFCLVDAHEDVDVTVTEKQIWDGQGHECKEVVSDTQLEKYSSRNQKNVKQSASETILNSFTKELLANLPRPNTNQDTPEYQRPGSNPKNTKTSGETEGGPRKSRSKLSKETPMKYSADAVEYLIDSETGDAKTCGKGSFGQVYNARFSDPGLYHIPIVVKEFDPEYTNKEEILHEAQRLMYLQDTGYVPICYGMIELRTKDRKSYGIIQEFVGDGTTLEQILWDKLKMPVYNWLTIALQCCDGLARFHDKGILLNDIKSNNIIIIFYGNGYVCIKYIDFGLATDMRGRNYRNTKSLEDFVYIAPEVRLGLSRTNVASDIFSLGYMLDQICNFADVNELKFVADLCMHENPHCRIPVKAAIGIIEEQMEGLELFTDDTQSE